MNECEKFKEKIKKGLQDLSDDLKKHLERCSDCAQFYNEYLLFKSSFFNISLPEPSESLLNECRTKLHYRLFQEKKKEQQNFLEWIYYKIFSTSTIRFVRAFVILIIGIFIGGLVFNGMFNFSGKDSVIKLNGIYEKNLIQSPPYLFNTRLLNYNPITEEVEVEFNILSRINLKGRLDEPVIKDVLTYALKKDKRSGFRLKVIGLFEKSKNDRLIEKALIYTLLNDPNPGVRLSAIKVLRKMKLNKDISKAFLTALQKDNNPGIRIEAIEGLSQNINDNDIDIIRKKAEIDDNLFVKLKAEEILKNIKGTKIEELR